MYYNQETVWGAEYWLQFIGNNIGNIRMHQVCPVNTQKVTKNGVCKNIKTYWTNMRFSRSHHHQCWDESLQSTGVKTAIQEVMNYAKLQVSIKFKMYPSAGDVHCLLGHEGKGYPLSFSGAWRNHQPWPLHLDTKLNVQISNDRPEKKTTFLLQHDNSRPYIRLWSMLPILAGLSYNTLCIVQIWCLLISTWVNERGTVWSKCC